MLIRYLSAALVAALLLCGGGCERLAPRPQVFQSSDITGVPWGRDFALYDVAGKRRTLADYRGKVVVLFFGYVHCPDVCPTTMIELKQVMTKLGPLAKDVQVLFVSLDPERDSAAVLAQYVPAFHPDFVGLRGSVAETEQVARDFKVIYQRVSAAEPGAYSIDHSGGCYVFDQAGHLRLHVALGAGSAVMEHDLRQLLQSR